MATVSVARASSYEPDLVAASVHRMLAHLGGMEAFVHAGERVLIKPNLLAAKTPEKAVTTHPEVVRAVVREVVGAGGIALVGDSPGIGSFRRVAERTGIAEAVLAAGGSLVEFDESVEVQGTGVFRRIALARPYVEADRVINVAKMKTHEMMTLTCAVKNLFGSVVGTAKAGWHLKAGADRDLFARMLVEIFLLRPPDLNIVDAIVGMEGDGPGSGDPRQVGLLLAGADAVAVDVVAADIMGIPRRLRYTENAARKLGLPAADPRTLSVIGVPLAEARIRDFRLPHLSDVQFGLPSFLKNRLRHYLTARPHVDASGCILCGVCSSACPPQAINLSGSRLTFDYHRCIRCMCCRELCPEGALTVRDGALLALYRRLRKENG